MSGLHRLGSIIDGFLSGAGTRNKIKSYLILDIWPQVIGSALEGKTEAQAVKNGVLYVTCVSPPLAHQLSFMKRELLKKIAVQVGAGVIRDIRFQAGEIDLSRAGGKIHPGAKDRAPQKLEELNAEETAHLDLLRQELIEAETDPALESAFLKAVTAAKRVRKTRMKEGCQPCQRCGALLEQDSGGTSLCSVCEQTDSRKHVEEVAEQLRLTPWKSYQELRQDHPALTQLEYQLARRDKLQQLSREINRITNTLTYAHFQAAHTASRELSKLRTLVLEYVMVYDARIHQDLTCEKVSAVLGKNTANCLFS
ncbi:MAG TPA: hypothetical protein DCY84_06045 [Firmicutes bacterium]|jgi:methylphosphotriester-DNA--protein-cysteine methyltransferase|nr:hypothetical protein [Bacillota bacterium]HBG43392.1 hypothetical protein [Bacillota bacterium]HBR23292.1 hypothetical protein [Bacillota bacterium]